MIRPYGGYMSSQWRTGGAGALAAYAPEVNVLGLRGAAPAGLDRTLLDDPATVALAEQFGVDVSQIDDEMRTAFLAATGAHAFDVTQVVYLEDQLPRLMAALDAVFGTGPWAPAPQRAVENLWPTVEAFMQQVARLTALEPVMTEIVRLRGARQHDCRLCRSRRSASALRDGADEPTFDAIDRWTDSDLPAATKAALGLVDAMIWTPFAIPDNVVADIRQHLSPAQAVEVALDVVRNAANKIAVALGADAPEVTDGVQLFEVDATGTLTFP